MLDYDDENLFRLFEALGEDGRRKALRSAVTRAANKLKREAERNLEATGLKGTQGLRKQIRRILYKKKLGFRVTIGPKVKKKQAQTEEEIDKLKKRPILMWAEGGTEQRHTKYQTKFWVRRRKAHPTGEMGSYPFMEKTRDSAAPRIEKELKDEIVKSIERTAKRYGCT